MVKHELRVMSYALKAYKQELKFKSASSNLQVTISSPRVTSFNPRIIKSMKTQVSSLKNCSFLKIVSPKLSGNS